MFSSSRNIPGMREGHKTKGQLIDQLRGLRAQIRELEASEAEHRLGAVKLQRSKEFIETVMNSITDSICTIDIHDFKVTGANETFFKALKMKEKDVIGRRKN